MYNNVMNDNVVIKLTQRKGSDASSSSWRDQKKEALRLNILEAASRLVADGGVDALNLRKVAEHTGASTMVVYTVFGSKDGLLAALWAEGFRRLWELEEDALKIKDPMERLRALGQAYRRNAINNSAFYKLVFGERLFQKVGKTSGPDDDSIRTFSVLIDTIAACQKSNRLTSKIPAAEIAAMFWSSSHGAISLELSGMLARWADPQKIYEQNITALIEGLKENG